jgi:hypothetical protein
MSEQQQPGRIVRSVAEIATPQAGRYLTQLCKHFQHKCPVTLEGGAGQIVFTSGTCDLRAEDRMLTLSVGAPDEAQLQDVVARHLIRFAFREEMQITWRAA